MSVCPHPRPAHEKISGPVTQLVCPDCGEVFGTAGVDYEPENLDVETPAADEICGKLNRAKDAACGREPEHRGDHDYTVDPGE